MYIFLKKFLAVFRFSPFDCVLLLILPLSLSRSGAVIFAFQRPEVKGIVASLNPLSVFMAEI